MAAHTFGQLKDAAKRKLIEKLALDHDTKVDVITHRPAALRSARSLATIAHRFDGGPIVYDPTGVFSRTVQLVRCASLVRAAIGGKADKILFDSWRRTLFVVLDEKAFTGAGEVFRAATAETMKAVAETFQEWKNGADFDIAVRVGFEPPSGARLVAVDELSLPRMSVRSIGRRIARLRTVLGLAAIGTMALAAPAVAGDDTAAVSAPNATLIGQVGYLDSSHHSTGFGGGGIEGTVPLGHSFGLQAEVGAGSDSYFGAAGHAFWRDPDTALVGAFASYNSFWDVHNTRFGGEAELYMDNFTLSGRAGFISGGGRNGGFGKADLSFYATPNFVIRAGFETSPGDTVGTAGFEYQPAGESLAGFSFYAEGQAGRVNTIMAGLKLHFGEPGASLMYRERHEDPGVGIFDFAPTVKPQHHYGRVSPPT